MDLSNLSRDELTELRKNVDTALKSFDARKRKEALIAAEAAAREHGFSLAEITGGKGASVKTPPKYLNPADATQTWSGRGRKPQWVRDWEAAGKDLSKTAI
jgi:DNA-binding protein H-NS